MIGLLILIWCVFWFIFNSVFIIYKAYKLEKHRGDSISFKEYVIQMCDLKFWKGVLNEFSIKDILTVVISFSVLGFIISLNIHKHYKLELQSMIEEEI